MKMNLTVSLQINARPEAKNRFFPLPFMSLIALLAGMMLCLHSPAFGSDNKKGVKEREHKVVGRGFGAKEMDMKVSVIRAR